MNKSILLAAASAALLTGCTGAADTSEKTVGNTEAVIENIMTRTSIRKFTDRKVSRDTLDALLKAGMAAPTAMNKQPWAFVAVTEREVLDSLMAVHPHSNLATATAAIIVCGDMQRAIEGPGQEYWVQDCSAATENILLAAHAYGLGAVWCGVYPMPDRIPDVSRVLELPSYVKPLCIVALGYPAESPTPKDKWNTDNVHYQRW
ncbi:MAG: nitroreductase family protein [Muribaculaceae bacterium]|nr:nitroreductase family protein [Muribaculaceae bacterium]